MKNLALIVAFVVSFVSAPVLAQSSGYNGPKKGGEVSSETSTKIAQPKKAVAPKTVSVKDDTCSKLNVKYKPVPQGWSTAQVVCGVSMIGEMDLGFFGGGVATVVTVVPNDGSGAVWIKKVTKSGNTHDVDFSPAVMDPSLGPNRAKRFGPGFAELPAGGNWRKL